MILKIIMHTSGTLVFVFCLICFVFTTWNLFTHKNKILVHIGMSLSFALSIYGLTIYSVNDAVDKFRNTKNSLNYFENFYQPENEYGIFEESNLLYKKGTFPYVKTSLKDINNSNTIQNEVFNFLNFFNEGYIMLEEHEDKLFTLNALHKNLKGEYKIKKKLNKDTYLEFNTVHFLEYESTNEIYKEILYDFEDAGFLIRSSQDTFKNSNYINSEEHHIPISLYQELPIEDEKYKSLLYIFNKYKNQLKFDVILIDKDNKETFIHYNYLEEETYQNK